MDLQGFSNNVTNAHARAKGAVGILEHHLHLPAVVQQLGSVQGGKVATVKGDGASGRLFLQQDKPGRGGLAAPGLAIRPRSPG